jgi:carboxylesterase type B
MNMRLLSLLLIAISSLPALAALNQPVKVTGGRLQGTPGNDPSVTVFRGVPYAAPPAGNLRYGAYHSAELVYVFNNLDSVKRPWTATDRKLADIMSSYWVNFSRTGDPNGAGLPHWPGFGTTGERGLALGDEIKPASLPPTERLDALKRNGFNSMF